MPTLSADLSRASRAIDSLLREKRVTDAQEVARWGGKRALRAGMVEVNGKACSAGAPFGGVKQSGNGREGGEMGLREFLEVKTIAGWPS